MGRLVDLQPLETWLPKRSASKNRVLDAFEEAVVRFGIAGASFSRIAEIGGFHRSLVQHHYRRREELITEALDRIIEVYIARQALILHNTEPDKHSEALVDWLLGPFGPEGPLRIGQVLDAYQALANTDFEVGRRLRGLYEHLIDGIDAALGHRYPRAGRTRRLNVAFAVVCMSFGRAGLDLLGSRQARSLVARKACEKLIKELDTD